MQFEVPCPQSVIVVPSEQVAVYGCRVPSVTAAFADLIKENSPLELEEKEKKRAPMNRPPVITIKTFFFIVLSFIQLYNYRNHIDLINYDSTIFFIKVVNELKILVLRTGSIWRTSANA